MFRTKGTEMGLQLNIQKFRLISANSSHPNATFLKDFVQMKPTNSCLLGAPLLPGNAMENAFEARCDVFDRTISRLKLLSTLDALLLPSEPASELQKSYTFFAARLVQITAGYYSLPSLCAQAYLLSSIVI